MKTNVFKKYEFWLWLFIAFVLVGLGWIQFAHAGYISQLDFSSQSQNSSWTTRVSLVQPINLSAIASSSAVQFYFKNNAQIIPSFKIDGGGWTDISTMDGVFIGYNDPLIVMTISSSTLIQKIATYTDGFRFFICNDAPACASNIVYGTANANDFGQVYWLNNGGGVSGNDTNLKAIYFQILTEDNSGNLVATTTPNWNFNFSTTTPGLITNATTSQGWIDSIWTTTSSAFYVDCSGNDGGFFTSSTLNAIGCQAKKVGMGILGMFVVPMPVATNYISQSFQSIQNVFPFSLVFGLKNELQSAISSTGSTSTESLDIPIYGHGNFRVLSSTTLEQAIGLDLKIQVFNVLKYIIWISAGVICILII